MFFLFSYFWQLLSRFQLQDCGFALQQKRWDVVSWSETELAYLQCQVMNHTIRGSATSRLGSPMCSKYMNCQCNYRVLVE